MSWVLIVYSDDCRSPPAVIGGYDKIEDAERAGDLATSWRQHEEGGWRGDVMPRNIRYVVIPGAAVNGPHQSVHCHLERDPDNQQNIVRHKYRFEAD